MIWHFLALVQRRCHGKTIWHLQLFFPSAGGHRRPSNFRLIVVLNVSIRTKLSQWIYCLTLSVRGADQIWKAESITRLLIIWLQVFARSLAAMILTHWGRDNMAIISQTTFSNAFFLNENVWLSLKISLKFVPEFRIENIPTLIQIMAWRRPGDKTLSEPMMVGFGLNELNLNQ